MTTRFDRLLRATWDAAERYYKWTGRDGNEPPPDFEEWRRSVSGVDDDGVEIKPGYALPPVLSPTPPSVRHQYPMAPEVCRHVGLDLDMRGPQVCEACGTVFGHG